jgi:A/G-specific adenine glycosylase
MQSRCVAHDTGRTAELPARKPKKATPEKSTVMLLVMHDGEILLEQRPPSGIWGGLQSLPELERLGGDASADDLHAEVRAVLADLGEIAHIEALPGFMHAFTHYRLIVTPLKVNLSALHTGAAQRDYRWLGEDQLVKAALPAPVRKLLYGM